MILTPENYHSPEANRHYLSVSQYKSFLECEAATMAYLNGEYDPEEKDAFIVGGYLHAWCESPEAFEKYKDKYQDFIYKKRGGGKYAAYEKADEMIECLVRDKKIMFYLQGAKEQIMTAEFAGAPWKIRIDVLNSALNYFIDVKTARSINDFQWSTEHGKKVSFIEQYGYMIQMSVYAEIERINAGRDTWMDSIIMAVTKEDPPDKTIISCRDDGRFEEELNKIRMNMPRILAVKSGEIEPNRCGVCKYCRATKQVDKIIHYSELMPA